jgi:hypothetical protein
MRLFGIGNLSFKIDYSRLDDKQLYDLLQGSASELKRRGIIERLIVNYDPKNPATKKVLSED